MSMAQPAASSSRWPHPPMPNRQLRTARAEAVADAFGAAVDRNNVSGLKDSGRVKEKG